MHIQHQGQWVFAIGLVVVLTSVLAGNFIQDELVSLGDRAFLAKHGATGWLTFLSFAFGFPLGMAVCATGMFMASEPAAGKRLLFAITALFVALSAILVPGIAGRAPSPYFFGTGGYIILVLVLATLWFWGRHRASLPPEARLGADLQGAGYLCFAVVAWNLCGVGGMPSFALDPEKMLATGSRGFAIGQMKAIMAALVAGWILTAAGYRMSLKTSQ
ncbi:MAG: hypothetical protein JAY99_15215 [Candidatus Thiodiazotropha lotti]|uniref:hypothetical protein n=1 Tax=Candidatus Thiodiazotropha endoloripes TaxID=1818881 RepID=UPI00083CFAB0|nr:hypothetical protein [Candidatus Thiodiazotropha endoloripes]MCG7904122.1 hypothetical protein [Candidatus Thiodiazotropha weberae]MCG7993682.1 hypothetical protein [Candidatus Thiodiazotropha lotti]MCG7912961.1 hypothetical protein [Candidatus Thiodiazotropha weberae]MCG8000868.1 hypothetical protein [Candidatus Thiodiazotropha lotti]MCW4185347.1 hypothetical protein [Candidatus Thiodiazotropha weberae]